MHVRQLFSVLVGPGMCSSKIAFAIGTRPGCATHVPSQPSVTSRSLSARTFSIAASLATRVVFDRYLRGHATHRGRAT